MTISEKNRIQGEARLTQDDHAVIPPGSGQYPEGSWIRSPHLSEHFPRVKEETLILVKVGHLPQG